jgi:hypothetical protein
MAGRANALSNLSATHQASESSPARLSSAPGAEPVQNTHTVINLQDSADDPGSGQYSLHLKRVSESVRAPYELPVKSLIGTRPIHEFSSPDGGDDPCAIGLPEVARQSPHAP